jgi:hypothetical protein
MTIKAVQDEARSWGDRFPDACSAVVRFSDDSVGEVASKKQWVQKHIDALKSLIGQPAEFELEDKGEFKGTKQWKIKSYPGKQQPGGGGFGGKRDYVPRWKDTEEGTKAEQDSIHRSVALTQAVAFFGPSKAAPTPGDTTDVLDAADKFYTWLSKKPPAAAPTAAQVAAQVPGVTTGNNLPPPRKPPEKSVYEMYLEGIAAYKNLSDVMVAAGLVKECLKGGTIDDVHYMKLNNLLADKAIECCPHARSPGPAFRACEKFLMDLRKDNRLLDRDFGSYANKLAEAEKTWETANQAKERF